MAVELIFEEVGSRRGKGRSKWQTPLGLVPTPGKSQPVDRRREQSQASKMAAIEDADIIRKRKREPSAAPSPSDVPSPGDPTAGTLAFRSGQGPEALSQSTAPLDLAALPTARISKLPNFGPAPNGSRFFLTPDVPVNRATFRYTPAGAAEPGRLVLHRSIENAPGYVRFSWEDRSPHIRVSQDGLTVEGHGGFRSARCNVPVREGKWYVEFNIERSENGDGHSNLGKHVRLGWARREASLNGPVGLDGYSYGIRDVNGQVVTLSRLRPYGQPLKQGDVIGLYISLPQKREANPDDPYDPARKLRKRIPIGLRLQPYFEMAEYPVSKEMKALLEEEEKAPLPTTGKKRKAEVRPTKNIRSSEQGPVRALPVLKGSRIAYFVNGKCQGVAFVDIYDYLQLRETPKRKAARERQSLNLKERHNPFDDGTLGYYPVVSLYHDAVVKLNAGPDFAYLPPPDIENLLDGGDGHAAERTWKPLCERYEQFIAEMFELDELEEEMARKRLVEKDAEPISDEKAAQREKRRKRDEARRKAKREAAAAEKLARRTETPPARGASVSMRAQSGTPQPTSSRPGGTPSIPASTPAYLQSDATPPPGDPNALSGAQRRRQRADWEQYVMSVENSNQPSRDPSATRDESSGRSSPISAMFKTEDGASPAIRSPAHTSMEVDE
jgi:COMPASS component BRE2